MPPSFPDPETIHKLLYVKGGKTALIVWAILTIIIGAAAYSFGFSKGVTVALQNQNTLIFNGSNQKDVKAIEENVNLVEDTEHATGSVLGYSNEFHEEDWDIPLSRIKREKDNTGSLTGFYCVKETKKFDSAEIWFRKKVPIKATMTLRYELKPNNEANTPDTVTMIFVYGKDRAQRIFFPDADPNFIGFEDNKGTRRERLTRTVDTVKETEVEIGVDTKPLNEGIFTTTLKYVSLPDEEGSTSAPLDPKNFYSFFEFGDPTSESATREIGFGAFNGVCFKPSYFSIR